MLGVTNDDQLVLDRQEAGVSWLPLRPGDAPYTPAIARMGVNITVAYLPPPQPGTAPFAYATATTPLPVTQLPTPPAVPTPFVPTPQPALLTSISALRTVPSTAFIFTNLPLARHVIYGVDGALYSQALSGGSSVSLGDAELTLYALPFVTPDERYVITHRRDGVHRVSLDSGEQLRLTPPLANRPSNWHFALHEASKDTAALSSMGWRYLRQRPGRTGFISKSAGWLRSTSVPIVGGAPVRLTPPLTSDSDSHQFTVHRGWSCTLLDRRAGPGLQHCATMRLLGRGRLLPVYRADRGRNSASPDQPSSKTDPLVWGIPAEDGQYLSVSESTA